MTVQDPVLYIVCDGEKARFLRYDGRQLRTVEQFSAHDKTLDVAGEASSIKEPKSNLKYLAKERFARSIASEIEMALLRKEAVYEGFVISAPSHVLHDIRQQLSKEITRKAIKFEVKELANLPDHEILSHFGRPATGWPKPS